MSIMVPESGAGGSIGSLNAGKDGSIMRSKRFLGAPHSYRFSTPSTTPIRDPLVKMQALVALTLGKATISIRKGLQHMSGHEGAGRLPR
jgi:hypothetical protein